MNDQRINFIGRHEEKEKLLSYLASPQNEFVAVYGRRRVGKTYLIKTVLGDEIDFLFTGLYRTDIKTQLNYFSMELSKKEPTKKIPKLTSWMEAFEELSKYLYSLNKKKVVVFLDELPWMDNQKSNFINALSYFWNMLDNRNIIIKLFVCGSSTTWMIDKLIGDKGGLYGRIGKKIYLAPFTLKETKQYLNVIKNAKYNNDQVLNAYMIFGGIPFYLDMIDVSLPFSRNIDNLFFKNNGELRSEFNFVFRSLFKDSINYQKVIIALSKKKLGLTRDDILKATKIEGGALTEILENLRNCDFIRCYSFFGKKTKDKIYQLIDPFTFFYLNFVKDDDGQQENYWTINMSRASVNSWKGYAFEITCLNHIEQIKKGLGISGINSSVTAWKTTAWVDSDGKEWPGAQIDLLIDRDDNIINAIEIKHYREPFTIDAKYNDLVLNRIDNFISYTKTKKSVINTFIASNGLKNNSYRQNVAIVLDLNALMD